MDVFMKEEATELPPHRPGIDLEINLEEGKQLPQKKIYPLGVKELEELHAYVRLNESGGWIRESMVDGCSPIMFVKKKGRKPKTMRRLPRAKRNYEKGQIPITIDRRSPRPTQQSQILHQVRHQGRLP